MLQADRDVFEDDARATRDQLASLVRERTVALRASEERLRLLTENMTDVIWTVDNTGQFTYVSPAIERLRGYSLEEALQHTLEQMLTPASAAAARGKIAEIFTRSAAGQNVAGECLELEYTRKAGATVWTEVSFSAMCALTGRCVGVLAVSRDVSDRKRAQAERERLIGELQRALAQVKTLSGLLPICSHCKKIRDDRGYWNNVESYVTKYSQASFTHSICPECIQKYYPEYSEG